MLKGDRPIYRQDEAAGEYGEISKKHLESLLSSHAQLICTLNDMENGLIHLTMSEYQSLSHKFMFAWRHYKLLRAEKRDGEKQGN